MKCKTQFHFGYLQTKQKTISTYRSQGGGTYLNGASHRRPQTLMSPVGVERNKIDEIELTITIQKDASGYGMKVEYLFVFFYFFLSFLFIFFFVFVFFSTITATTNFILYILFLSSSSHVGCFVII